MERKSVTSSNIKSIGYEPASLILEVEFKDNSIYQYYKVPVNIFNGLMQASSHGSFLDAKIKKGGYQYKQTTASIEKCN